MNHFLMYELARLKMEETERNAKHHYINHLGINEKKNNFSFAEKIKRIIKK